MPEIKKVTAYQTSNGDLHETLKQALEAEIAAGIASVGGPNSVEALAAWAVANRKWLIEQLSQTAGEDGVKAAKAEKA